MTKQRSEPKRGPDDTSAPPSAEAPLGEGPVLRHRCHVAAAGAGVLMFIIVCALSRTHVFWPDDQYSDMNTLMSGENFATYGLFHLHMLPVHYIGAMTDPPSYYTHYPPLPNVMNGLMQIVGIRSLAVMRVLCGLLCIAGLICMYLALAPDVGSMPAACGLAFVATSGYFFTYCVSVHQHTFNILFMGVFLLLFTRAVRGEGPTRGTWIGCWLALTLESLTSFEFILYPQVFAWVYVLATGQLRKQWRLLVVLATAPLAGVLLHFLQNCWAMGWSWSVTDAVDAFRRPGRGPAQDRWVILKRVPDFVLSHSYRLFYWSWPILPVLAVVWLALTGRDRLGTVRFRRAGALLLAVMAGSVSWYLFMPIHTVKHPHTMSQLLLLVMIAMGGAMAVIVRWLIGQRVALHERVLAGAAAVVVVFGQTQTIAECFERARTERPVSFYLLEALGDTALPPKVGVLTNTYADAQMAYFLRRPLWRCPEVTLPFTPEATADLQKRLPDDWEIRYYIFDTRGDQAAFETLASLCPGYLVTLPGGRTSHSLIIFDIRNLFRPPGQRKRLAPKLKEAQKGGAFPIWKPPGFQERLTEVLARHGKR